MSVSDAPKNFIGQDRHENDDLLGDFVLVTSAPMTAAEFKALRTSLGLSQADMARILGVVVLTITRAEKRGPTRELEALLEVALARGQLRIKRKDDKLGDPMDEK